ncbi:hypothetical protein ACP4OV_017302 [Aristida adscensionis]
MNRNSPLVPSMSGGACSNLGFVSRDMNGDVPVSTTNSSGPSIGVSSLVMDANSSHSGGAQLQPSTSMNAESLMRVPASPMSFSSNNISGSSVIDGSMVQQSPPQEHVQKRSSSVTSQPVIAGGGPLHAHKRARADARQDDILQHQLIQQLLHGHNSIHLPGQHAAQLQALIQQQKLLQQRQHQQMWQPFSQIQQPQIGSARQPPLRPPPAQPGMQLAGPVRTPVESGLCSRRLMQYLYHKRHRPENNHITYWRKVVEEYFAPRSKERWCVSSYEKRGNSSVATPVTPQAALDIWHCDICNTHAGKGYEATYEVLPRLYQIRFDRGVVDEYLFLDTPTEFRMANGQMLLEHKKVIQKSIYEHLHVTHEGHLRIVFTPELKIMSWDFCSRRHEEYITRRILAPQVHNLLQVAQKYQDAASESGPAGVSNEDAQTICNMFVTASRQLAKNLDHHTLNEHGLSKRYVRCLQISEVVNHMKDLIEFSHKNNLGPKESLDGYRKQTVPKLPVQNVYEATQPMAAAGFPNNQGNIKVMGIKQEMTSHVNETPGIGVIGNNTPQNAAALNNYQNLLRSSSVNQPLLQQEASSLFKGPAAMRNGMPLEATRSFQGPNQVQLGQFQHPSSLQQPMLQQNNIHGLGMSSQYQQHVINKLVQEVRNSNNRSLAQQPPPGTANVNSGVTSRAAPASSAASGEQTPRINNSNGAGAATVGTGPSNVIDSNTRIAPSRSNSFKSVSSNPAAAAAGGNAATAKAEPFHDMDELDHLINNELVESGLFMGDQDTGFSWNM